ncbi:MAG: RNA methyltransferase [Euryarchaeota archaeon]|jgi:TrmH family RNA methyltransferase|nr:RNA methyltransferase [Euryarchaeota archaeon]MBT5255089.1 RNA methyltransferase [Euryarchaeota archaeon]
MGDRVDLPLPKSEYQLEVILVGATHPGNLGAVCRTMLNHGYCNLRLVNPICSPDDVEARKRAKHAGMILENCQTFDSLKQATEDVSLVIGTSGKREKGKKTFFRHFLFPWEVAEKLSTFNEKVAIIFGEEGKGLSTEDLEYCDFLLTLPTWEGYPIANLSHAVNSVLYELHRNRVINNQGGDPALPSIVPLKRNINPQLREKLNQAITEMAESLSGLEEHTVSFQQTLQRSLMRSMLTNDEATRILGGLVEATTAIQHLKGDENWQRKRRRRIE